MIKTYIKHHHTNNTQSVGKLIIEGLLKRKIMLFSLVFLVILLPILYLVIRYQPKIEAAWYDDTFAYRQRVDITNAGTAQTDFQVAIILDTATLVTAGKMQSDCDDIRVTDVSGKVLPHWIETGTNACNTTTTAIWTKVPSISTSGATVYLYYGNPSAINTQNGDRVFLYFDDFSSYSLGALPTGGKWTWESSVVSPTIVDDSGTRSLRMVPQSTGEGPMLFNQGTVSNTVIQTRVRDANNSHYHIGRHSSLSSPVGDTGQGFWIYPGNINLYRNNASYNSWSSISSTNRAVSLTTYHSYKVTANGSSWAIYEDGASSPTHSGTEGTYSSGYPSLITYASENMYVDYFFVRTFTTTEPTVATPTNEEKSQGPVAYWKFDEGNGTTANDSSGKGKTGTFLSAPLWKTEDLCVSGKCLAFDNVDDGVSIANENFTSLTDYTMCAWINPKGNHKNYTGTIMSSGDWNNTHWAFGINQTNTQIQTRKADGVNYPVWNYAVPLSKWTYICLTRANTTVTAYVNGVQTGSPYTGTTGNLISNATNTAIGRETYAGGYFAFNGSIDEPKIYNYARSAAQIKADYASKGVGAVKGSSVQMGTNVKNSDAFSNGLVGYWKMDEASGNAVDSSGNGNTATIVNAPTYAFGKYGNSVNLSTNQGATVGSSTALNTSYITTSAWIYPTSASGEQQITNKESAFEWALRSGILSWAVYTTTTTWYWHSTGYTPPQSQWTHVVITYDGNNIITYANGEIKETFPYTGTILTNGVVNIGCRGGTCNASYWNGRLDEIRLFNRALSSKEVRDLYAWAPGPVVYWNFENDTTSTITDKSGSGLNLTIAGSPTYVVGKFGKALKINGGSDAATSASTSILDTDYHTIGFWLKFDQTAPANWGKFFGYQPGGSDRSPGIWTYPNQNCLHWRYDPSNSGPTNCGGPSGESTLFTNNQWYYITGVKNGATFNFYVNGVQIETGAVSSPKTAGSSAITLGGGSPYVSMDEVKIYNYARSSKQIVEDMNAGHPSGGSPVGSQVGYWKMDEGNNWTANDSTPNAVNGAINGATWSNSGKFGKALNFNGTNNFVTQAKIQTANVRPNSEFDSDYSGYSFEAQWTPSWQTGGILRLTLNSNPCCLATFGGGGGNFIQGRKYKVTLKVRHTSNSGTQTFGVYNATYQGSWPNVVINKSTNWQEVSIYMTGDTGYGGWISSNTGISVGEYYEIDWIHYDLIDQTDPLNTDSGAVTVSSWVKLTDVGSWYNLIYSRGDSVFRVGVLGTGWGGTPLLRVGTTDYYGGSAFPWNQWTHIAYTFDDALNTVKIYINGKLDYTNTSATATIPATTNNSYIGFSPGSGYYANGLIDEVKVYNSALTEDEIKLDYNQGSAMVLGAGVENRDRVNGGLTLYLDATDQKSYPGSGTVWYDQSGNNRNATLSSPIWNGLKFTNTSATLTGLGSVIYPSITSNTTILWVYPETGGGSSWLVTPQDIHTYMSYSGDSNAYINTWDNGSGQRTIWNVTESVPHQIVITKNGNVRTVYDNLVQKGQVTLTDPAPAVNSNIVFGNAGLPMGLSIVKVYNRVLSMDEITQDYYSHAHEFNINAEPIAEWKFDEKTGTTANDTSGNGNTGTLAGSPVWKSAGECKAGSCLTLDRTDDRMTVSHATSLEPASITVEAWINLNNIGDRHILITKWLGYSFEISAARYPYFRLNGVSPGDLYSSQPITWGRWHHIAATLDNTTKQRKIYLDGINTGSETVTGSINYNQQILAIPYSSASWSSGAIDQVRIFNYARTPAQIAYDYNRGAPVGHWKLDECQGTVVNDSSGNGNAGTITIGATGSQTAVGTCTTSGTAWGNGATGKYNSSLNVDGTDDYISVPYNDAFKFGTGDFTIAWWANHTALSGLDTYYENGYYYAGLLLRWQGEMGAYIQYATGSDYYGFTWTPTLGQWYHMIIRRQSGNLNFFVNGIQVSTTRSSTQNIQPSAPTFIGHSTHAGATQFFNGKLDDFRVYNYAITTEQVKSLFNQGSAVRFGPVTGTP